MATLKIDAGSVPVVMGMDAVLRQMERDGKPRLAPNDKPLTASGVIVTREGGGAEKTATVAVIEAPDQPFKMGEKYKAEGDCWVTPYVSGSGQFATLGMSYQVTRLVPVTAATSAPAPAASAPAQTAPRQGFGGK